jgi:HEAT repeat protein
MQAASNALQFSRLLCVVLVSDEEKPAPSTERLIESLYARKGFWARFGQERETAEIVRQIAAEGDPAAIPDLLPILIIGDSESVLACSKAVHSLLQQLKPAEFAGFDEFIRRRSSDWRVRREPWYLMKPTDISRFVTMGESSVSLLGVASSHLNGRVREAAIRELGKIESGAELPFLLVRANDWVPEIRTSAQNLLLNRVRSNYIHHFMAWLPLVLRLRRARRGDHSALIEGIRSIFASTEAREILPQGFTSRDRLTHRFCFEIALDMEVNALSTLRRAFAEGDSEVRKIAVRKVGGILPTAESKELLMLARNDASMAVRREALRIIAGKYAAEAGGQFQSALLDNNVAVREEAQYYFRQNGAFDSRAYYLEAMKGLSGRQLCAAVGGLGEVGLAKDAKALERFARDESSKLRHAALHAMAKLNPDAHVDEFVVALEGRSRKVSREAVMALCKKANSIGGTRLWEVYNRCRYPHGKRGTLYLLARINKWDSIAFLVRSLADDNDVLVELSRRYVGRWFARYNRSFAKPTTEQRLRLKNVLLECKLLISAGTERQLELLLDSFEALL